jgi:SAM-dependent methyltransferase
VLDLDRQNHYREQYRATHPGWTPATEQYFEAVTAQLSPEACVLDLGCGRGGLVEQLPPPRPRLIGIDPDWHSLVEHRIAALPRAAAVSHALPLANNTVDLVVASWVLEHLDRPGAALNEIARVLRPDGSFVFITPNGRHPLTAANRLLGRTGRWQKRLVDRAYGRAEGDTFSTHYRANTPQTIAALAGAAGLRVVMLTCVPDPSYLAFTPWLYRITAAVDERLVPDRGIHLVGVLAK